MAKQQKNGAHVPKFGNWDNDGNVPYTLYFDNARKGKGVGAKPMNPNDPVENPEAFSSSYAAPSPRRPGSEHGRAPANLPPPSPPPAHRHERRPSDAPAPPPPMSPSPYGGASPYRGEAPRRGAGRAGGYSVEQSPSPSPLHPYSQSRAADNSVEGSPYGLVANSVDRPNRARGPSRGNETPTRGSAVPKFGDWDSNPASADGYTHIFNKVREEKSTQAKAPRRRRGSARTPAHMATAPGSTTTATSHRAAGASGGANRNGSKNDGARISGYVNCVKLRRGLPLIRLGNS